MKIAQLVSNDINFIFLDQTTEIIEKLKSITLLEAKELIKQIEETFGVSTTSISEQVISSPINHQEAPPKEVNTDKEESTFFDLVLQEVPSEDQRAKRLSVFRIIRELTSLGLKESKELTNSLPKIIKESMSREEAEEAKKQLESAGAKIIIQ